MTDHDQTAEPLFAAVHAHLRAIAERQMAGERTGHTLQATALVHEAWLSLQGRLATLQADPQRFYLAAAEAMRCILIDHARRRGAQKRGGSLQKLSLDVVDVAGSADLDQVLAIDEAIQELGKLSERAATVVRLRFFAGLDEAETAGTLGISERSVRREWAFARAWLYDKLA